ncbi:benzoate/H(+) symporter BenE family transporter [Motilimonas sp. E26]|uniref:benzoate/H(+) symporter BenE family transporter n=1 Tax=Motilimonas sp. E26 TaxID=2865674 RepID=UPI001E56CC6B|nr:benzoate/H(+) symporter BenE family transporter [Motilimonas sp. E26]MCE0555378.1 benzoate/H(+) symporter BenE family transporter [Motilimonas sp. E26]
MKIKFSHISTGFIAVFIGYASAAAIIFQAATSAGASQEQITSWFWALGIGMGVSTISLSWHFKQPIVTAWSTPGAALLVTSLQDVTVGQAVAAFMLCSALITLVGVLGWFDKLLSQIPTAIASAMLAGVLLQFGLGIFTALLDEWLLVVVMLAVYIIAKVHWGHYLIPGILVISILLSALMGKLDTSMMEFGLSTPTFISPDFQWLTLVSVGIPLFIVTMASQNLPGFAVLKANGYQVNASRIITVTGLTGLILAPLGGFAFNLAALTGAICMSDNADKDPKLRYLAAIAMGVFYLLAGVFAASFVSLFTLVPSAVVMTLAGLALMPTLCRCLMNALVDSTDKEPALMAFLLTASGINLLGIASAFWGLLLGMICYWLQQKRMAVA